MVLWHSSFYTVIETFLMKWTAMWCCLEYNIKTLVLFFFQKSPVDYTTVKETPDDVKFTLVDDLDSAREDFHTFRGPLNGVLGNMEIRSSNQAYIDASLSAKRHKFTFCWTIPTTSRVYVTAKNVIDFSSVQHELACCSYQCVFLSAHSQECSRSLRLCNLGRNIVSSISSFFLPICYENTLGKVALTLFFQAWNRDETDRESSL